MNEVWTKVCQWKDLSERKGQSLVDFAFKRAMYHYWLEQFEAGIESNLN